MSSAPLRRAILYVPSSSPKYLLKSLSLKVDSIAYDLEDSVLPSLKSAARAQLLKFLQSHPRPAGVRDLAVRINAVESGFALDDLTTLLSAKSALGIDTLIIPKVHSASDLHFISDIITHLRPPPPPPPSSSSPSFSPSSPSSPPPHNPANQASQAPSQQPIKILALIESARALSNIHSICTATPQHLEGLIFGAEDLAQDMHITPDAQLTEFHYARSAILTAARAHNLPTTLDLVCTASSHSGDDGEGESMAVLKHQADQGMRMGFSGKQIIHPLQIEVVQAAFSPARREVEWAVRVVVGDEIAGEKGGSGKGAWMLGGRMVDRPVVGRARAVLALARELGVDVDAVVREVASEGKER